MAELDDAREALADLDAGTSYDKQVARISALVGIATVDALTRCAVATEALVAEMKRANGPSIDDDPWEAAEQQMAERQAREAATKKRNNSRPRPERRGGVTGRTAKGGKA